MVDRAKILVDLKTASAMKMEEAIDISMKTTMETHSEVLFTYDPGKRKLTSAIIVGEPLRGVPMPHDYFGDAGGIPDPDAVFHTHPNMTIKIDKITGMPDLVETDEPCSFSSADFETDMIYAIRNEMMLGCPGKNKILTFRRRDIPDDEMTKIIVALLSNRCEGKVVDESMNRINLMSWELKKKFPEIAKDVEKLRESYYDDDAYLMNVRNRVDKEFKDIMKQLDKLIDKYSFKIDYKQG